MSLLHSLFCLSFFVLLIYFVKYNMSLFYPGNGKLRLKSPRHLLILSVPHHNSLLLCFLLKLISKNENFVENLRKIESKKKVKC
jgi:hypothetical protein